MTQKEIIHIHLGRTGIRVGCTCWELFCLEHAIQLNGVQAQQYVKSSPGIKSMTDGAETFYNITEAGRCEPRCVMIDMEPSIINETKTGTYKELFRPELLISGKEDAAYTFAKGMYTMGRELLDVSMDRIRRTIEECENLQGFIIYRSYDGGTGAGFGTILSERLYNDYSKCSVTEFGIYPSPRLSSVIVGPYNTLFSIHGSLEFQDISNILENQAVYGILERLGVNAPTYKNINRLLAQVISSYTTSLRAEDGLNVSLQEMEMNLIPYPRLHFPLITYSPFVPMSKAYYEELSTLSLTNSCFDPFNQMIGCNPENGKFLSCCLLYRGNVQPTDVNTAVQNIKNKRRSLFVDWCPSAFKVSINYLPPTCRPGGDLANVDRSLIMLSNTTAIKSCWEVVARKFRSMYNARAYIHNYLDEGMELDEFDDALDDIEALIDDYREVEL